MATLQGKKIAILATNGFEQSELFEPLKALHAAGAEVKIVSPEEGEIKGWQKGDWGAKVAVDVDVGDADPQDFDGLMIPGGVMNSDKLRMIPKAVEFVRAFAKSGKPIAAICHAPWILIEADVVKDRTVTSWPSLRTDLLNAGAIWVDEDVVTENGVVTSRKPEDIPAFNKKMIEEFAEGQHRPRTGDRPEATLY